MSRKQIILKGTLLLTVTGVATRLTGFFYRMFLSHTFGEEGVGLYQLIFPVYALGLSLTSAGVEVILARLTAKYTAVKQKKEARELLYTAIFLTVLFSCIVMLLLQNYAPLIASDILRDDRCQESVTILSYAFPFAAVHSCICGYCFGMKKPFVPAVSQLFEQGARIAGVCLISWFCLANNLSFGVPLAVGGLIIGEIASSLYCLRSLFRSGSDNAPLRPSLRKFWGYAGSLLSASAPLTASRVLLNLLQSLESVSIPLKLQHYGMTTSNALSTYGVLTGMALPCILFPSALTNSISAMLLPEVAEIQALSHGNELRRLVSRVVMSCITLGTVCCAGLLVTGQMIGTILFHSPAAGSFIVTLAWMCPFLYTNTTLISILNGIGKTALTFLVNCFSLFLRIASIFLLIPGFGIKGYLWGMLASQLCIFLFCLVYLRHYIRSFR